MTDMLRTTVLCALMEVREGKGGQTLENPYGDFTAGKRVGLQEMFFSSNTYLSAKDYLSKYLLSCEAYESSWAPLVRRNFGSEPFCLQRRGFPVDFESMAMLNGKQAFTRKTFGALQRCMRALGETHFVMLEDRRDGTAEMPMPYFRMVYPVDIAYDEFWRADLGAISEDMQGRREREFLIMGNSGAWGQYAATNLGVGEGHAEVQMGLCPMSFIGFKPEYAKLFVGEIGSMISNAERDMLRMMLPPPCRAYHLKWLAKITAITHSSSKTVGKRDFLSSFMNKLGSWLDKAKCKVDRYKWMLRILVL